MAKQIQRKSKVDPLIGVRVPVGLRQAMKDKAKQNDRTFSAEVRQAMRLHVDDEDKAAA